MGAMQQMTLMQPWVTGGTDLGTESYARGDSGDDPAIAVARFNFNTAGTVTVAGIGTTMLTNTTPFTNWNTNGGTYLSYELLSWDIGGTTPGGLTFSGLTASSPYGENRQQVSVTMFQLIASGNFDSSGGDIIAGYASATIKVSIWSAATGGTRQAFGIYTVTADASA